MTSTYNKIVSLATDRDFDGIRAVHSELIVERMKMDKFFSMFLEKFSRKMDPDVTNTPIWSLYKKKHSEYGQLQRTIIAAEYYMKKSYV